MPADHFSLVVPEAKLEDLISFLTTSLGHLGFKEMMRPVPHVVGLGEESPYLWISAPCPENVDGKSIDGLLKQIHVAFAAENREQVKEFHTAALKAGGTCNGVPELRPHYHPGYYGAYVRDPVCGMNFEVVCHKGE